jgi:glycerophosphoryl diester phosphodiesterase
MPAVKRIGHKGAAHIAPGNTAASFDAALAAGVDMIEFDILEYEGRLLLAHDLDHVEGALTLDEGLAHLAPLGVDLDVDLKLPGYEQQVVEALRAHGLVARSLVSTQYMRSLVAIRELEPALRLGWSVPRVRRDYTRSVVSALPAYALLARLKRRLPPAARRHIAAGRCDAVMAHFKLVTERLVRTVADAGGELYVWTVDDAARIRSLEAMGVTGVITNDPRLFA